MFLVYGQTCIGFSDCMLLPSTSWLWVWSGETTQLWHGCEIHLKSIFSVWLRDTIFWEVSGSIHLVSNGNWSKNVTNKAPGANSYMHVKCVFLSEGQSVLEVHLHYILMSFSLYSILHFQSHVKITDRHQADRPSYISMIREIWGPVEVQFLRCVWSLALRLQFWLFCRGI